MKTSPVTFCVTPGSMSGEAEAAETLLGGRIRIAGQEHGLKTTTDTVMLAAAVVARDKARVLDAGCGAGGAMLCLARRLPSTHVTGLERDPALVNLARRNIALNHLAARVTVREGDVAGPLQHGERFDVVMTNPPHLDLRQARAPQDPRRAGAMVETMPLEDWIGHCLKRLAYKGAIILVHRAERLGDILGILARRTGAIDIMPLLPRDDGTPAKRVLVRATRGSARPLRLLPGLVLHGGDGRYTPRARHVLEDGAGLKWC